MNEKRAIQRLVEVTNIPTAAGLEAEVMRYVLRWADKLDGVAVRHDEYGNLLISKKGAGRRSGKPILLTAHLDHPAFVVQEVLEDGWAVWADFRGGVRDEFFVGSKVRLHGGVGRFDNEPTARGWLKRVMDSGRRDDERRRKPVGEIEELMAVDAKQGRLDKRCLIRFGRKSGVCVGDMLTWAVSGSKVVGKRLKAPVCDDLAAVAAAMVAFEAIYIGRKGKGNVGVDVRLLFTRCEEVGFIGAMGACRSGLIPQGAHLVVLENSKSFVGDSPIGGGPIIRVGDRISTFNHELNHRITQIAEELRKDQKGFAYQRKLMPGGACESTAYQAFGYQTTCLCLPLGNYHNMNEETNRIDREVISTVDYLNLIALLVAVGKGLNSVSKDGEGSLQERLDKLFISRVRLLKKQ
ncbi:hypothetical protein [Poriferisphaera sp. WC338]|uniref:hypothetical protein n=1 Tax=Poriferisphaera sp. WC338 TaxID=3425129 RepID=UPI003D81B41E